MNKEISVVALTTLAALIGGCAPVDENYDLESEEISEFSQDEFDELGNLSAPKDTCERSFWGDCFLSGARAPFGAEDYDVVALSDTFPREVLNKVREEATRIESTVFFTVQERDHLQYVLAAPSIEGENSLPEIVSGILAGAATPSSAGQYPCNRLYRYPGWVGSQFMMCSANHNDGLAEYGNLNSYGFNNKASSYYTDNGVGVVKLYNKYYYSSFLVELDWDDFNFSGSFDNKASSVKGYF